MGMDIDTTGHDVTARRIDNFTLAIGFDRRVALADYTVFNQQILSVLPVAINQNAVLN
ncbi:hypothetical protein D3C75_1260750 [compost metagenome]